VALSRRAALQHRAQQVRLGAVRGDEVSVAEMVVEPGAPCDGVQVKDIPWPQECVIASLRRGRKLMIPHGNTTLQAGDVLVAVAGDQAREDVRRLCTHHLA
jgi:CIC family chloride channel protein